LKDFHIQFHLSFQNVEKLHIGSFSILKEDAFVRKLSSLQKNGQCYMKFLLEKLKLPLWKSILKSKIHLQYYIYHEHLSIYCWIHLARPKYYSTKKKLKFESFSSNQFVRKSKILIQLSVCNQNKIKIKNIFNTSIRIINTWTIFKKSLSLSIL
jgi:hypothetical protein